jgi:hypothetical protein
MKKHNESCEVCKKAMTLRFAGALTAQINNKRCAEGKRLAEKAFKSV